MSDIYFYCGHMLVDKEIEFSGTIRTTGAGEGAPDVFDDLTSYYSTTVEKDGYKSSIIITAFNKVG